MEISFKIKEKVTDYILKNQLIKEGDTVLIGVSGGADSICLLFLLSEISEKIVFSIKVIHVEHGIRGKASLDDADYVRGLCNEKGFELKTVHVDALSYAEENSLTLEEAARILRYRAFEEYRENMSHGEYDGGFKIAVAHHINDQAETVIFQMLRGSGIKGMGGMSPQRENIIRPLLCLTKEEILLYLSENNLSFRTDESNNDNSYSRNYIRNDILPRLNEIQPQAEIHISEMAGELREIEEYLTREATVLFQKASHKDNGELILNLKDLADADDVIVKTIIRMAVGKFIPNRKDIGRNHFDAVFGLIKKGSGKSINLPKDIVVSRTGETLVFRKGDIKRIKSQPIRIDLDITKEGSTKVSLGEGREADIEVFPKPEGYGISRNTYTKCFDYDKIEVGLQIRNAGAEDYLIVDNKGHRKAIKDYFVNEKIPSDLRDEVLVVADGKHVLWVIGYRISEQAKITENTKEIVQISITGGFPWVKK